MMRHKDRVLVFSHFPFDFRSSFPIRVGEGLFAFQPSAHRVRPLAGEPEIEHAKRESAIVASISPFHGVGAGHVHFALRGERGSHEKDAIVEERLFAFLAALRLWRPLPMQIDGAYEVDVDDASIGSSLWMYRQSAPAVPEVVPTGPEALRPYSARDLRIARALATRVRALDPVRDARLLNAWTGFAQATLGTIGSAQMTLVALFGVLESILTPGQPNGLSLGRRTARAIGDRPLHVRVEEWVRHNYERLRHSYAHGNMLAHARGEPLRGAAATAIPTAHELARLCLLRWLLQPTEWRARHQALKGPKTCQLDHVRYQHSPLWNESGSVLDLKQSQIRSGN